MASLAIVGEKDTRYLTTLYSDTFRCDEVINDEKNSLPSAKVKKIRKLIRIWQSVSKNIVAPFFESPLPMAQFFLHCPVI